MNKYVFLVITVFFLPVNCGCPAKSKFSISYDLEKLSLDESITEYLEKYGHRVPLIDLGFAVGELCQALREQPLLKNRIISAIEERRSIRMTEDDAAYCETEDHFFRYSLRRDKEISRQYAKEIESMENGFPMLKHNNRLTDDQIRREIEKVSELSGISEASTGVFNLLVFDAEKVISIVQDSQELTIKYRCWLSAIQEAAIFSPWTPGEMLERKKAYILKKYSGSTNELMKETLDIIRNAAVRYVE
jgi:hypothetical protein